MNLLFIAPVLKNNFWEDENEVRMILYRQLVDDELVSLKVDEKGRNYIELELSDSVLSEVIIAPFNNKTIVEVKSELSSNSYNDDEINVCYSSGRGVIRRR